MASRPKRRELGTAVEPIGNRIERLTITSRMNPCRRRVWPLQGFAVSVGEILAHDAPLPDRRDAHRAVSVEVRPRRTAT